jgi:hypothetical protein
MMTTSDRVKTATILAAMAAVAAMSYVAFLALLCDCAVAR